MIIEAFLLCLNFIGIIARFFQFRLQLRYLERFTHLPWWWRWYREFFNSWGIPGIEFIFFSLFHILAIIWIGGLICMLYMKLLYLIRLMMIILLSLYQAKVSHCCVLVQYKRSRSRGWGWWWWWCRWCALIWLIPLVFWIIQSL